MIATPLNQSRTWCTRAKVLALLLALQFPTIASFSTKISTCLGLRQ